MKKRARFSLALEEKARLIKESVTVTDSELEQYFSAYQVRYTLPKRIVARMIVLPNRKLAAEVYVAAKKGADFAVLASKYSILGKTKNGALGAVAGSTEPKPIAVKDLGEFPKNLITDAFNLVRGGMTRMVSANEKHYIIKVSQYLAPKIQTLNDIRAQVERDAKTTKAKGLMEEWRNSVLSQAQIRFTEENFDPVVARVSNQEIHFSSMRLLFDVFSSYFNQERISRHLNDQIKQVIPQHSLTAQGFQALGDSEDRLDAFLELQANNVIVTEAEVKAYYQTNIKQFQERAHANDVTYLFKRKELAEAFQKAAFNLGDVPQNLKSETKLQLDFYNPAFLQSARRSPKKYRNVCKFCL
jgi:hypothetical protein